jgi:membrane protein YqaA with SNARE-associated domain
MILWQHQGDLPSYIINLSILTVISYGAGVLGYYIGVTFTKSPLFRKLYNKYLIQYEYSLQKYGMYLVLVGAITPVPFSAMCMLAGSVKLPFKPFLLICIARIIRFAAYGWMVWKFPGWFDA